MCVFAVNQVNFCTCVDHCSLVPRATPTFSMYHTEKRDSPVCKVIHPMSAIEAYTCWSTVLFFDLGVDWTVTCASDGC